LIVFDAPERRSDVWAGGIGFALKSPRSFLGTADNLRFELLEPVSIERARSVFREPVD
jgi:hypothetical protein